MRNLVRCPSCENNGRMNVLGEIDSQGHFLILRFHNGITRVIGDSFTVVCDLCSEPIYIRKGGNFGSILSYGVTRVFGFSSSNKIRNIGTHGTTR